MTRPLLALAVALALAMIACGGDDDAPTESPTGTPTATARPTPSVTPTPAPTDTAEPTATPVPHPEPIGFPIDPGTTLGVVTGDVGSRTLVFDSSGPAAYDYSFSDQASGDTDAANRSGWNCRTHIEYEGIGALDFYIPVGTPIIATMDGTVTINVISIINDFDRYGVSREPYIGNPDRARAPLSPFPGPSGGMGVYAVVENESFVTEYGHLDLYLTDQVVPKSAWYGGYTSEGDWAAGFSQLFEPRVIVPIASWQVRTGDVIGISGDSGYSEGPHVHYTLARTGGARLCPTNEPGFDDGGWLFR